MIKQLILINLLGIALLSYTSMVSAIDSSNIKMNITSSGGQVNNLITETVPITFTSATGTLPTQTPTCPMPPSTATQPTTTNLTSSVIYNSDLSSISISAGYTCNITIAHYQSETAATYLTENGIPVVSGTSNCASKFPNMPTNLQCTQGQFSTAANTSVCYTDNTFPAGSSCNTYSYQQWIGGPYIQYSVASSYNAISSSGIFISNGTQKILVPNCNTGKILMNLSNNSNYSFTYTRNYSAAVDKMTLSCAAPKSPPNIQGNYTCSGTISITPGNKNTIIVSPSGSAPYSPTSPMPSISLTSAICSIGSSPTLSTFSY